MSSDLKDPHARTLPSAPWGSLPSRMRVLHVATRERTGGWLTEAFAADSASTVLLEEAIGAKAGLESLRDQVFDAVLISHEPGELDGVEFLEGLRAGGAEEPLIVLGADSEEEMAAVCYEVGADAYLCTIATTTRTLLWTVARAIERHNLIRENRRLVQADRHRLQLEQNEASRILNEQRGLIRSSIDPRSDSTDNAPDEPGTAPVTQRLVLSDSLQAHYRELLRAQVIMGSGNLNAEMHALADLLVETGVTARQAIELHVQVLEELIRGLGSRSARHVMTRADLLVVEVLLYLGEGYRRRYLEALRPLRQLMLPGFSLPAQLLPELAW